MAWLKVSNFVDDVYKLCGNVTRDQLPLELVLLELYHELDKRRVQMRLTENDQFLKSAEREILNERDQLVSVDDFGTVVAVHLINPFSQFESPVEVVNFNALPNFEADGQLKVALYGTPLRIRFSIELEAQVGWTLKFWYEPNVAAPRGINADVYLDPNFKNLVTTCVALYCLPHAEIPEDKKSQLMVSFTNKIGDIDKDGTLENIFFKAISFQGIYSNNTRQPFRAGQPRVGRYRR